MPERKVSLTLHAQPVGTPDVAVDVHSFDVPNERLMREDADAKSTAARQIWNDLDDQRRAALVSLISEGLSEMAGSVEDWLAGSLVATSDQRIGIFVLFKLGNLDDQIIRLRAVTEAEQLQRIADLERISSSGLVSPTG